MTLSINGIRLLCYEDALASPEYYPEWIQEGMEPGDLLLDTGKGDILVIKAKNRKALSDALAPY